MTDTKLKRLSPYSYRPPADKRAAFELLIANSGLPVNAFITECVFGRSRHRPGEIHKLGEILVKCAIIADALRELQLGASHDAQLEFEEIKRDLRLIRSAIMERMGRRS